MSISADDTIETAFAGIDAAHSGTPPTYITAIRTGTPGSRHHTTVAEIPAQITLGTAVGPSTSSRDIAASFAQLRDAMHAATQTAAATDGIQPQLPAEISMVTWRHNGQELRLAAPGAAPTLRRARLRRRLTALSPLPLLGALTQPLTAPVTAIGIAIAPVLPPVHQPDTPAPVVQEMTGEISRPQLPYTADAHASVPTLPPLLPHAEPSSAPDTAPTLAPLTVGTVPSPTPTGSVSSPAGVAVPRVTSSPTPSPAITTPAPSVEPSGDTSVSPSPSPIPTPTVSPTRRGGQIVHPRARRHTHHRHPQHKPHPLPGLHWRR
jgi:hypothetical protein